MKCTPEISPIVIKPIEKNIYHLHMDSCYDLAMTVCRITEWGECPSKQFKRKNFSLHDYMRWYAHKYGKGAFTYPTDWSGFNLTSEEIEAVAGMGLLGGKFAHSEYETRFFDTLRDEGIYEWGIPIETPFSIICTSKGNTKTVLPHELAHGRWYTNKEYKKAMKAVVQEYSVEAQPLFDWLKNAGYHANLYEDETHAYALTGWPDGLTITKGLLQLQKALMSTKRKLVKNDVLP